MDSLFQNTNREFRSGNNAVYFPWIANGDDFGLGPAQSSISVQNLEDRDGQIWVYRGNGDGSWTQVTTAYLASYASKTFTASMLGFGEGEGGPVAVLGWNITETLATTSLIETAVTLTAPRFHGSGQVVVCVVNEHETDELGVPAPFMSTWEFEYPINTFYGHGDWVPWSTQEDLQNILVFVNRFNPEAMINPFGGLNRDGDCNDRISGQAPGLFFDSIALGGVSKAAVNGTTLPYTSDVDKAVSGYNAINGAEVGRFSEWYLPIVQTNCGPGGCWDSMLRVSNLSEQNSSVEVRFFAADVGQGSLQTGFQVDKLLNGGETWHIQLSDLVPEGWVGSAHIYSDGYVFPMVDRFKVGYSMWLTNTGSASNFENAAQVTGVDKQYTLFAPHVLMGYFGWNTGINVANLADADNDISVQYFNMLGNATQMHERRLAPHGMTYFYDPAHEVPNSGDPNRGVVGSAIIWSQQPVAATVDATKYPDSNAAGAADLFQATSYNATQNIYTFQAIPLVQKGNPSDGMGASSGINMINPHPDVVTANVYWVNQDGFNASNFGVSSVTIPGFANGFVYSLWQHNLPNGFYGAAQVIASAPIGAVSANVDYQVDGDGSVIYNAFNPCGYYRTAPPPSDETRRCYLGDPFNYSGQSVSKRFIDEEDQPIQGVQFHIAGQNPDFPYQRHGISGADGWAHLPNVPPGEYQLNVDVVPDQYSKPANPADTFTLVAGTSWSETNRIFWKSRFSILACLPTTSDPDDSEFRPCSDVNLRNFWVRVYEVNGFDDDDLPIVGRRAFDQLIGRGGTTGGPLATGTYLVCFYLNDLEVETTNYEEKVETIMENKLPENPTADNLKCGTYERFFTFTLTPGSNVNLEVPIFAIGRGAALDIKVHSAGGAGVQGVEICIEQEYWTVANKQPYPTEVTCKTSDDRGHVIFPNIQNHDSREWDEYIKNSIELQQAPGDTRHYRGKMWVTINSTQWRMLCATGGEYTAYVVAAYFPEGCGTWGLEQGDTRFYAHYVPTWDLFQDEIGNDIHHSGTLIGSYDIEILVGPR